MNFYQPNSCQYPLINYLNQDDSAAQSYEKSSIRRRNPRMLTEPFSNSSNDDIASNEIDSLKKRVCFCHYAIWQYGLWSFQVGGTKLERFLHKNQHPKGNY